MSRLSRAAALGLIAGLALAAVALVTRALFALRVDCAGLSTDECNFEHELGRELARQQALAALGLLFFCLGLWLFLRRKDSK